MSLGEIINLIAERYPCYNCGRFSNEASFFKNDKELRVYSTCSYCGNKDSSLTSSSLHDYLKDRVPTFFPQLQFIKKEDVTLREKLDKQATISGKDVLVFSLYDTGKSFLRDILEINNLKYLFAHTKHFMLDKLDVSSTSVFGFVRDPRVRYLVTTHTCLGNYWEYDQDLYEKIDITSLLKFEDSFRNPEKFYNNLEIIIQKPIKYRPDRKSSYHHILDSDIIRINKNINKYGEDSLNDQLDLISKKYKSFIKDAGYPEILNLKEIGNKHELEK